jgi:hypothetical protein
MGWCKFGFSLVALSCLYASAGSLVNVRLLVLARPRMCIGGYRAGTHIGEEF